MNKIQHTIFSRTSPTCRISLTGRTSPTIIIYCALCIVHCALFFSCQTKHEMTESVTDIKNTPQVYADSITTIVSDSGIIRYRIIAPEWYVYEKADTPYWDFPNGLRFERFDENYKVDAEIECDRAVYYSKLELWKLNDNVEATNLNKEEFYTNELYWDQKEERVYSDSAITIIQKERKILGVGFESNQTFSRYSIRQPKGTIPIEE